MLLTHRPELLKQKLHYSFCCYIIPMYSSVSGGFPPIFLQCCRSNSSTWEAGVSWTDSSQCSEAGQGSVRLIEALKLPNPTASTGNVQRVHAKSLENLLINTDREVSTRTHVKSFWVFTNTQNWQYLHYYQLGIPIFAVSLIICSVWC